jgi:hypothetical protein
LYHADQQFKEAAKMTGMDAGVYGIKKRNGHDSDPKKYKGGEKRGSLKYLKWPKCYTFGEYGHILSSALILKPDQQSNAMTKEDFKNLFQARVRDTTSLSKVHVADYEDISLDLNLF